MRCLLQHLRKAGVKPTRARIPLSTSISFYVKTEYAEIRQAHSQQILVLDIAGRHPMLASMKQDARKEDGKRCRRAVILCALFLTGLSVSCSAPEPLATLEQGETGRVVRIIDGDALVLDTGLRVRLVGVEAPAPKRRNREGEPYADTSSRLLEDLSLGRQVRLIYPGITRDRYDRALAYVVTNDALGPKLWLNQEILRRGGARARLYPDTAALGEHLLAAEQYARTAQVGLWELSAYTVLPARDMAADARGFYIVTGTLGAKQPAKREGTRCVRRLVDADLALDIQNGAGALCQETTTPTPARFRGYVRDGRMEITHSLNVEMLEAHSPTPSIGLN